MDCLRLKPSILYTRRQLLEKMASFLNKQSFLKSLKAFNGVADLSRKEAFFSTSFKAATERNIVKTADKANLVYVLLVFLFAMCNCIF